MTKSIFTLEITKLRVINIINYLRSVESKRYHSPFKRTGRFTWQANDNKVIRRCSCGMALSPMRDKCNKCVRESRKKSAHEKALDKMISLKGKK